MKASLLLLACLAFSATYARAESDIPDDATVTDDDLLMQLDELEYDDLIQSDPSDVSDFL